MSPDPERDPVPLVYVLSNGRSGSTLLDLLLGSHPRVWTLGELQVLPHELREQRAPCGCGEPVGACPFWTGVLPELETDGAPPRLEHFREAHGFGRVVRPEHLCDLVRGRAHGARAASAAAYADRTVSVLRAAWRAALERSTEPVEWLVDASKDPYRLLWLRHHPELDLRVVHLYKDPRAFVHAMRRGHERGRATTTLRFAARWRIENGLMSRLYRTLPAERRLALHYEDLAADPAAACTRVARVLDVRPDRFDPSTFRERENHAISGNSMRWREEGVVLDETWRSELPAGWSVLVGGLCAGLSKRLDRDARRAA